MAINTVFLTESLNIVVVILWYFSDNGDREMAVGKADTPVR
jgi:hypothetical protein